MTEEFQKCVFEPFAQEHAGSRTKFAGTGLGMAIAKKLVEKMGGTITFESEEGAGTTFVIRVPFRIDTDREGKAETEAKTEASIRGLHILLAEDNELNMEIAEFLLENENAVITKAWNGKKHEKLKKFQVSTDTNAGVPENGAHRRKHVRAYRVSEVSASVFLDSRFCSQSLPST